MTDRLPSIDFDQIGPAVGDRFPDIRLPNQWGEIVDLHRHREGRGALIVFVRSADW